MKVLISVIWVLVCTFFSINSFAGYDVTGYITSVQLNKEGALRFALSNRAADTYCKVGWGGLSFHVPYDHKDFPYYYGLISSANINKQKVRLANISVFDGSSSCDVTQTGYGIVVYTVE